MTKTTVVALDISIKDNVRYKSFRSAPFEVQLANLVANIQKVCDDLTQKVDDESSWIIAWREYSLTDGSNTFISVAQKRMLKTEMEKLTKMYPKLTIISGTVATQRTVGGNKTKQGQDKRQTLEDAYFENQNLIDDPSNEFQKHQDISTYLKAGSSPFILIRNTTYVFNKGSCIARHDKTAPWDETSSISNAVFRPGRGRTHSPYINDHYNAEICREHALSVLKNKVKQNNLKPPMIHFVLSASIDLRPINSVGTHNICIDSKDGVTRYSPRGDDDNLTVYSYCPFDNDPQLQQIPAPSLTEFLGTFIVRRIDEAKYPVTFKKLLKIAMGPNCYLDKIQYSILALTLAQKYLSLNSHDLNVVQRDNAWSIFTDLLTNSDLKLLGNSVFEDLLMKAAELKHIGAIEYLLKHYRSQIDIKLKDPQILENIISMDNVELLTHILSTLSITINTPISSDGGTIVTIAKKYFVPNIVAHFGIKFDEDPIIESSESSDSETPYVSSSQQSNDDEVTMQTDSAQSDQDSQYSTSWETDSYTTQNSQEAPPSQWSDSQEQDIQEKFRLFKAQETPKDAAKIEIENKRVNNK